MKRGSLITVIMFLALAVHSEAADRVTWKMAISRGCARFMNYNIRTILFYKQSRLTQEEAFAELTKEENDPATKIMAKSTIESVYKNRGDDASQNACMNAVFAYDPDGAKTEALKKKQQEEYEIRRKAEADRQAKERAEREEAAKEALAIDEELRSIKKDTEEEVKKAGRLPKYEERLEAIAAAEKRGEERKKQRLAERAKYMSERLAAKRGAPESAGKTDSQLRDEIRKEDRLAKEQREAEAKKEEAEARAKAEAERLAAEKAEQDVRDAAYEERQAEGRRQRVEELRRLGVDVDEKTLFGK
ncbi:MAG: hypothetical protein Q7T53_00750 [Deltaproteobacteria bacterium]|nr:hypothetical protein [Deltaproteobacteria bacterium]